MEHVINVYGRTVDIACRDVNKIMRQTGRHRFIFTGRDVVDVTAINSMATICMRHLDLGLGPVICSISLSITWHILLPVMS
jgi:hypothetical protein